MGIFLSLVFGFIPMILFAWCIYWLDRYEKEPRALLGGVFTWGVIFAAGGAFLINTGLGLGVYLFTGSEAATELTTTSIIAPFVEECLKGLAVFIVFLIFRSEFDSILDGVVYAGITALGFAATENAFYIYTYGYKEAGISGLIGLVFIRVVLVGWQHPFYTAFTGIGLAITRYTRNPAVRILAPAAGLSLAILAHSAHNTISTILSGGLQGLVFGTFLDWTGWFFMLVFVLFALRREKTWLAEGLKEELDSGLITLAQYQALCTPFGQTSARLNALFNGRYRDTRRFYQTCAELAQKKRQLLALGEEGGNTAVIERLREELGDLSAWV